jgi:hypothetical protein
MPGTRKTVNEGANMWGALTAESQTPLVEFDYIGSDAWAACGKTEREVAAMPPGDRLEARQRQVWCTRGLVERCGKPT